MSAPEAAAAPAAIALLPLDGDAPVFPTPWAARAFALAVALNERGVFAWSEWAEALGAELRRPEIAASADPEAYWRAWLAAVEEMLCRKRLAGLRDLAALQEAWRRAAEATPHGEAIELAGRIRGASAAGFS